MSDIFNATPDDLQETWNKVREFVLKQETPPRQWAIAFITDDGKFKATTKLGGVDVEDLITFARFARTEITTAVESVIKNPFPVGYRAVVNNRKDER